MKIDKSYFELIQSIKKQIIQSRYAAARLANREQLMLYFKTGMMISEKIKAKAIEGFSISSALTNQIENNDFFESFASVSFTHHFTIITKIKTWEARIFYIQSTASNFWSVLVLEHHIENDLYGKEGKLPNNFDGTLAENLKPAALKMFKDEYLLDFIAGDETGR